MLDSLPVTAAVFALIAALIHVYIFVMESLLWRRPAVWKAFGAATQADADTMRPWALNQGFYNLFLAIGTVIGVILGLAASHGAQPHGSTAAGAGVGIVLVATASMLAAAVVLIASNPKMLRGAAVQGTAPLIAIIATVIR
jgi:putative membrane protein